ncbi:MAG: cytochrome o ubiquinol oxidase subunit III [Francisellaceae bacterium]
MSSVSMATNDHQHHDHHYDGSKYVFGFWIYIMSDCVLFSAIFATFEVLRNSTFGGPGAGDIVSLPYVLAETMLLLTSSFTYGLAMLSKKNGNKNAVLGWLMITFILGLCFIGMELYEFADLIREGNSWSRSAFLSAFFTLVGTHGLHVTMGLIWMIVLMLQVKKHGITPVTSTKLTCLGLFWHFLDIVWIFVFSIVYLIGAA